MNDVANAVRVTVEEALAPFGAKLHTNKRSSTARNPHGWLYSGNTTPGRGRDGYEDPVYLHLFADSIGTLREMETAVIFLDGYTVDAHGDAVWIRYQLESMVRTLEENEWHSQLLLTAKYWSNAHLSA
jgi:hypothetical protein